VRQAKNCKKFEHLLCEVGDRDLTELEEVFMAEHSKGCASCGAVQNAQSSSLKLLKDGALNHEGNEQFDLRLVRIININRARESYAYWFPAVISAGIAAIAAFALMQILSGTYVARPILFHGPQANNGSQNKIQPKLVYPTQPKIIQVR